MRRRQILAVILILFAIGIAIASLLLGLISAGTNVLGFAPTIPTPTPSPTPLPVTPTPKPKPTPILTVVGTPPTLNVRAAYLLDDDTGNTLDDFNGEVPLPMASTTKITTAMVAIETGNLDQVITIHQDAIDEVVNNEGSSAQLRVGDQITLKDLLYALLLPSGDDAAVAIADGVGGSGGMKNFVAAMNALVYRLHLFQTHFSNSDGLPAPNHYTTAYDLVRLAQYAMKNKIFADIVKTTHHTVPPGAHNHKYTWNTINALLAPTDDAPGVKTYPGTTGIKTGYTPEAGGCLVFSATHAGHHLIGVVLHSADIKQRFLDAETLLNWGFSLPLRVPGSSQ